VRAAERALAAEFVERFGLSPEAAGVLARMRVDELLAEEKYAANDPVQPCCAGCWELLQPGRAPPQAAADGAAPFERCVYCGQGAYGSDGGGGRAGSTSQRP